MEVIILFSAPSYSTVAEFKIKNAKCEEGKWAIDGLNDVTRNRYACIRALSPLEKVGESNGTNGNVICTWKCGIWPDEHHTTTSGYGRCPSP